MMRARCTLLSILLVLLVAVAAGAQTAPSAAAPADPQAPALCAGALLTPQLPAANTVVPPFFATTLCGSCSDSHCQGHSTGSICANLGVLGHCMVNDNCAAGGFQCLCLPGNA